MAAHVLCLTSAGGIPIFVRKKGEGDVMSFSKVASLNGVHMFLKSQNIALADTETPDTCIVWKTFANSLTLIALANGTTKCILEKFLNSVFAAMILVAGFDEIKNLRNVERLKRDLRACNPIIDKLLECLDIGDRSSTKSDLMDMTSVVLCSENYLLQTSLEMFMECLDSMYGCIVVRGCLAVATESWWDLDPIERKLLIMAVTSETNYSARDIPVFLPKKSPNIAFRLVSITLVNGVEVLGLCGPNPELSEVERLAVQCWRSNIEILRTAEQCYPRNIPSSITPDSGILAFLLVNYKIGKYVISRNSQQSKIRIAGSLRLDVLRTFYYQAVETFLISEKSETIDDTEEIGDKSDDGFAGAKETYWCSEYHKCHALKENDEIICILYTSSVPTHTMRFITRKTLKALLTDKQVCCFFYRTFECLQSNVTLSVTHICRIFNRSPIEKKNTNEFILNLSIKKKEAMDRVHPMLEFQDQHDQTIRLMNQSLLTVAQNCHILRDNVEEQRKLIVGSLRSIMDDNGTKIEVLKSTLNFYDHTRSELVKLEEICHEYRAKIQADIATEILQRQQSPAYNSYDAIEKSQQIFAHKYLNGFNDRRRSTRCSCNWTNVPTSSLPHTQDINYGPKILMPSEFDDTDLNFKQEMMILRAKMFSMSQKRTIDVRDKENISDDRRLSIGSATKKEFIEIVKKIDTYSPPPLDQELEKVINLKFVDGEFITTDVWMKFLDTYGQQLRTKWYFVVCPRIEALLRKRRVAIIHFSARKTYRFIMKIPENGASFEISRKDLVTLVDRVEEIDWLENTRMQQRTIDGKYVAATLIQSCWRGFWIRKRMFDSKCKYIAASIIWVAWIVVKKKRLMHERYLENMLVSLDKTRQLSSKFSLDYSEIIEKDHTIVHLPSLGFPLEIRRTFGSANFAIFQNTMSLKLSFMRNPRARLIYILPVRSTDDLIAMYENLIESILPKENANERVTFLSLSQALTFANCSFNSARTLYASEDTLVRIRKMIEGKIAFFLPWIMDECDMHLAGNFGIPLLAPDLNLQREMLDKSWMSSMIEDLGLEQPYRVSGIKDYATLCNELAEQICLHTSICVWLFKLNVGLASKHTGIFLINHMSVSFMPILRKERDQHGDEWYKNHDLRMNFVEILREHLKIMVSTVTRFSECYRTWEEFYSHLTKYGCLLQAVPNHKSLNYVSVTLFIPGYATGETTKWTGTADKSFIDKDSHFSTCAYTMPQSYVENSNLEPVIGRLTDALQKSGYFGHLTVDLYCFRRKRDDKIVTLIAETYPFYDYAQQFVDWMQFAINGSYDSTANKFDADVRLLPDIRMQSSSTIVPFARTMSNWNETTRRFGAAICNLHHSQLSTYNFERFSSLCDKCGIQWNSSTKEGSHLILHDGELKCSAMLVTIASSMQSTLMQMKDCLRKLYKALRGERQIRRNSNFLEAIDYVEESLSNQRNASFDKCDPLNRVR